MTRIKKILSILLLLMCTTIFADSPITSTDFYDVYSTHEILNDSYYEEGTFTTKLMDYLDGTNPIDVKMAIINKLSWDYDGKNNARIYLEYLFSKYNYIDEEDFVKRSKGDNLLCVAYLKAMDDYLDDDVIKEALLYAEKALKFKPTSFTYNVIYSIIRAQNEEGKEIYDLTNALRYKKLDMDMKPEAIDLIYEYMDLYEDNDYAGNFNSLGIHNITGTLYNEKGYDKEGYNKEGYNEEGYNKEGYDKDGYDEEGWNIKGINRAGIIRVNSWFIYEIKDAFDIPNGKFTLFQKMQSELITTVMINKDLHENSNKLSVLFSLPEDVYFYSEEVSIYVKNSKNSITIVKGIVSGSSVYMFAEKEAMKFANLIKVNNTLTISIPVQGKNYIGELDCKGFTELSKKYLKY